MTLMKKIAGIFNYCDRWCERCTFTSRCAVYEDETGLSPEELDMSNKAFWDRIGENFAKAQDLLRKMAAERGVDLDVVTPQMEEKHRRKERLRSDCKQHPLALLSLEYSKFGRDWLKTQPGMLDRLETLKSEFTMGMETEQGVRHQTQTIRESIAVIQWYLVFIHVKLSRALMGRATREVGNDEDDFPKDHDGSAKIAIIGIERSMNAWSALFDILPAHEDHFLKVLSMLERIRSMAIAEFPDALAFVRPGFDD